MMIQLIARNFIRNIAILRFLLTQSNPRDFRICECRPGHYPVVSFHLPYATEQGVERGEIGLERCHMGKLVRARHITTGKYIWIRCLHGIVDLDGS